MNDRIDIQFKGLTTSPSDYACGDGEMAVCHNLVNEQGELAPILPPTKAFELPGGKLLYLHRANSTTIAIFDSTNDNADKIYYGNLEKYKKGEKDFQTLAEKGEFGNGEISFKGIGNILIAATSKGPFYYKYTNGTYEPLGNSLPDLPKLHFGMHVYQEAGRFLGDTWEVGVKGFEAKIFEGSSEDSYGSSSSRSGGSVFYDNLMAALEFSQKACEAVGGFAYPFMLRYAFRLYDGTTYRCSAPILMTPLDRLPTIKVWADGKRHKVFSSSFVSFLTYRFPETDFSVLLDLARWSDIIESIDVYVSRPLYTWHTGLSMSGYESMIKTGVLTRPWCMNPEYKGADSVLKANNYVGCCEYSYSQPSSYLRLAQETLSSRHQGGESYSFNGYFCPAFKSWKEWKSDIEDVGDFHLVASIPFKKATMLNPTFSLLPIDKDALSNLSVREALVEDYLSNYDLIFGKPIVYNNRILAVGEYRDYKTPYAFDVLRQYANRPEGHNTSSNCYVKLLKEDKYLIVPLGRCEHDFSVDGIFYPDSDAVEYLISVSDGGLGQQCFSVPLSRHPIMQCAYWMPSLSTNILLYDDLSASTKWLDYSDINHLLKITSNVYLSEVNNPFVFPSQLSASVGNGNILSLAATTLPISEGQQGQFPVMAFTDEGIWALEISREGSIYSTNPMLRDVLTNVDSLCVIDDGIVYATSGGLRILRGKQSVPITDMLRDTFVGDSDLPNPTVGSLIKNSSLFAPPNIGNVKSWAQDCRIVYSSALRRLYVLTKDEAWSSSTALVYSLDTGTWSSALFRYTDPISFYPTTYVQRLLSDKTEVYDISEEDESATTNDAAVLTRPLKFGARDIHKTIMELVVRGHFNRIKSPSQYAVMCDINQVLYGSNDLRNWYVVNSSRDQYLRGRFGTPYKYFRLLVIAPRGLGKDKRITGASLEVQQRLNNTLR